MVRPARFPQSAETGPSRPVFGDDFVQIFGCEFTAAVGCQTVVSLLDPEGIDSRIGPVEAVQKILHQRNALRRRQLAGLPAKGLGPYRRPHSPCPPRHAQVYTRYLLPGGVA